MKRRIMFILLMSIIFSSIGCTTILDNLKHSRPYNLRKNNLKELEKSY